MADWKNFRRTYKGKRKMDHNFDVHHRSLKHVYFAVFFVAALVAFFLVFGG